jgi:hypothetical protein
MNNLNKQLFTELTPIEAAAINGGEEEYRGPFGSTDNFYVDAGLDIKLSSFTKSYNNAGLIAELQNLDTGENGKKWVSIGNQTTYWNNVRGGNYKIQFRNSEDNIVGTRGNNSIVVNSDNY